MKIYLVGGAVRDELLGQTVTERDWVVVEGTSEEMLSQGFTSVGKDFPVFLHPQTKEEYALARTERKVAGGYHGFEFDTSKHVTLEEDLKRRDLTINAIAKSDDGKIIDPYGGRDDLKNKVLRHVSEAFIEDPVRVLRVARFASRFAPLGFKVAPETVTLMQEMVRNKECDHLVPERVWKEMERALGERAPVEFIRTLRASHALGRILPEVDALYGVPQSPESHPEVDTGIHMELVLEQATLLSSDPVVRFAALTHDLGKALTPPDKWPKHPNHEKEGETALKSLCQRLRVPNDYHSLAKIVMRYHGDYYNLLQMNADQILSLFEHMDLFRRPQRAYDFMAACLADFRGRPGFEDNDHPSEALFKKAFEAALKTDVQAVIATLNTKEGLAIKNAIREARKQAIEALLKTP